MHLRWIIDYFYFCMIALCLPNITRLIPRYQVRLMHRRLGERETNQEGHSNGEKSVNVSYPHTPCSRIFLFSYLVAEHGTLYQPKMSLSDILGMRLNSQPGDFTVLINPTFNYCNMMWGSVSFAQKRPAEMSLRDTFYLYTTAIGWIRIYTGICISLWPKKMWTFASSADNRNQTRQK